MLRSSVLRDGEFSKVVADHLRLDLNLVELLSGVNTHDGANHLRDDDHVTEVSLHDVWLLVGLGFLLGLAELLDQTHWLALESAVEPSAGASVDDITELLRRKIEEPVKASQRLCDRHCVCVCVPPRLDSLVKVDATVGELAERSLSLQLCRTTGMLARYPIFQHPFVAYPQGFNHCGVHRRTPDRVDNCIPAASSAFCGQHVSVSLLKSGMR